MESEDTQSPRVPNYNPSCEEFEIDQEKLKGDAIGESLYSERFVLSTLIKLTKLEENEALSEDFEKDLCILWDMTIEKDVIRLLLTHNVLELFAQIIHSNDDERLTEILIGIIGNMCSLSETRDSLCENPHVIRPILELIASFDPPTLVQLMRLLHACLVFENTGDESAWFQHFCHVEDFVGKFAFILTNSVNKSLLFTAYEALNAIAAKFAMIECQPEESVQMKDVLLKPQLISGIIEAFRQLIPSTQDTEVLDLTDRRKKIMNLFLDINAILSQYDEASRRCYNTSIKEMQECLESILAPYCHAMNLLPPTANEQGVIENVSDILMVLSTPFPAKCFTHMITIWGVIEDFREKSDRDSDSEWTSPREEVNAEDISTTILDFLARITRNTPQNTLEDALKDFPKHTLKRVHEKLIAEAPDLDTGVICVKLELFFKKHSKE